MLIIKELLHYTVSHKMNKPPTMNTNELLAFYLLFLFFSAKYFYHGLGSYDTSKILSHLLTYFISLSLQRT